MPNHHGLLVAALCAALTRAAAAEVVNRIIATIDGEPVTQHELDEFARERKADPKDGQTALQALITDKLLEKEIKAAGIEAKADDVERAVTEIRQQNRLSEADFPKALAQQGYTLEGFRKKLKGELERNELVNREVRGRVNVSPQEIERHFEAHKGDYAAGDKVTLSDIVIRPAKDEPAAVQAAAQLAKEVAVQARAGDFAELARRHSQSPSAKDGGLLGTFTKTELDARLATVAFKMKVGEVSDPIPTNTGFHIIRVEKFSGGGDAKKGPRLDDVKDEIREELYQQQIGARFQEFLTTKLRERHHVVILD